MRIHSLIARYVPAWTCNSGNAPLEDSKYSSKRTSPDFTNEEEDKSKGEMKESSDGGVS